VSGRKKEKEERRDVRSTRYLMDQGNDDVKSKRKSGLRAAALLFCTATSPSKRGNTTEKKKSESITDERKKKEILPCCLSISSLIAPFSFFLFCYIDPHP
jgi:hypothetical protein